jgi:hypothetical protein
MAAWRAHERGREGSRKEVQAGCGGGGARRDAMERREGHHGGGCVGGEHSS